MWWKTKDNEALIIQVLDDFRSVSLRDAWFPFARDLEIGQMAMFKAILLG